MDRKPMLQRPTHGDEPENALVVPEEALKPAKYADEEGFVEVSQSTGFLPFISIVAKSSDLIAEKGFQGGHIALKRGQAVTDLGPEISQFERGLVIDDLLPSHRLFDGSNISGYPIDRPSVRIDQLHLSGFE